jgi:CTP synthase
MEVVEIKDHPWFVGVQFHPEYLSRVLDPSRPYLGFVAASAGILDDITRQYQHGAVNGLGVEGIANGVAGLKVNGDASF